MELVTIIGSVVSTATATIALITLIFKKPKEWLKKWIKGITKEGLDEQLTPINDKLEKLIDKINKNDELEKTKLGHSIMTIYDRSIARGYITLADKKDIIELHQAYHDKHGNHHVDEYYEIMMEMDVIDDRNN